MTLSSRIAALTMADREIDAGIADLLGWWPESYRDKRDAGKYQRFDMARCGVLQCPSYTANIMHVFEECEKRRWGTWHSRNPECSDMNFSISWNFGQSGFHAYRNDPNITLAACEALVRAVENNPVTP